MAVNTRIQLKRDTWANWAQVHNTFIPLDGEIIIYTDYRKETYQTSEGEKERYIPAFKVGNGNAYLGDLAFSVVTPEEIELWNNKLNFEYDPGLDSEGNSIPLPDDTLVFNRK